MSMSSKKRRAKKNTSDATTKINKKHRRGGKKRNGYHAKTRGHARKRNSEGGGMGMRVLRTFGIVLAGAAVAVGGMLLLSATSLSAGAQDGILIAGGVVFGGIAFALGKPGLAAGLATGPTALALSRRVLAWGITSRAAELLANVQTAVTPAAQAPAPQVAAPTPAASGFYGYAPAGYLTATPGYQPGMAAMSVQPGANLANMTTPMVSYQLG